MKDEELRFEVLKLIHNHGLQAHQIADRADALVKWIKTAERPADPAAPATKS